MCVRLHDRAKITYIHLVINVQWHAKVGLPFLIHPVYGFKRCAPLEYVGCADALLQLSLELGTILISPRNCTSYQ